MTCPKCNGRGYFTPPLIGPFDGVAICTCPAGDRFVRQLLGGAVPACRQIPVNAHVEESHGQTII